MTLKMTLKMSLIASVLALFIASPSLSAKIIRSSKARHDFMVMTGYPKGRPGYVVDHIIPLCAGGADAPINMQWMSVESAKLKDVFEKQQCEALRKAKKRKPGCFDGPCLSINLNDRRF